ncbi:MAG TPA: 2'-5' RNA ligase family protein [Thermomicrobiales bacterium]|nr:2'-5' RNA ligase family protein [Thermomicrobiales bacterium]
MRHPLSWLPDIPVEQQVAYVKAWDHFRSAGSVADGRHDTDDWSSRDTSFAICCVRIPPGTLGPAIEEIRAVLAEYPFVRLHPDDFLHIPIQELGFLSDAPRRRDEINFERLEEFSSVARIPIGEYPQFTIRIGGINSFLDAPFLDVQDGGWISRIHRRLLDIAVIPPNTRFPFLPHITLGHYTESAEIGDLGERLEPWRDITLGEFEVNEIEIVTLRTNEAYPPLVDLHGLPLATASHTTPFTSAPNAPH